MKKGRRRAGSADVRPCSLLASSRNSEAPARPHGALLTLRSCLFMGSVAATVPCGKAVLAYLCSQVLTYTVRLGCRGRLQQVQIVQFGLSAPLLSDRQ